MVALHLRLNGLLALELEKLVEDDGEYLLL